jgi:hypothetical protein
MDGNKFAGYLVYSANENTIPEINLEEPALTVQALGCFLNHLGKTGDRDLVYVNAQPWETAKLEALSAFAEDYRITTAYSFAVFDWQPLLSVLLQLTTSAGGRILPDGEASFRISRGNTMTPECCFRIAVEQGKVRVNSGGAEVGDRAIALDPLQAVRLFFSTSPWASPTLLNNPFLRSILPLPLFFESSDGV